MSELTNLVGKRTVKVSVEGKVWDFYVPSFRLAGIISKIEGEETDIFVRLPRTIWELGRRTEGWVAVYPKADDLMDRLDLDDLGPLMLALKELQRGTVDAAKQLGLDTEAAESGVSDATFQPTG